MAACVEHHLRLAVDIDASATRQESWVTLLTSTLQALPQALPVIVVLRGLTHEPFEAWEALLARLRESRDELEISIWTPGWTPQQLRVLENLAPDAVYSSLPWWDGRAAWLIEEYERLRRIAPVVAPLTDPRVPHTSSSVDLQRRLAVAYVAADGVLTPALCRIKGDLIFPRERLMRQGVIRGPLRLTGLLSAITALFRADERNGRLLLLNPSPSQGGVMLRALLERRLPNGFVLGDGGQADFTLEPDGWMFVPVQAAEYIVEHGMTSNQQRRSLSAALRAPRIAIEDVSPVVDGGAFPAKRCLGESIAVRANIFMDGHEILAAEVLWRAANESTWKRTAMVSLGNDAWEARITPRRLGRYVFSIRAWHDRWGSFCEALRKKAEAGADVSLDVEEGRRMLDACLARVDQPEDAAMAAVQAALTAIGEPAVSDAAGRRRRGRAATVGRVGPVEAGSAPAIPQASPEQVEVLLDAELGRAVASLQEPAFETHTCGAYPLSIERNETVFSSWYELFPRSQSREPGRHGTLLDVVQRLPEIRRMGFDVLYFPPIHPIGRQNRKGRNNSLQAGPDDPGSPYAIGAEEGGHETIHPELGTLEDFRVLVEAARQHGMEIALDFAIQCSPDHPWLREHPDWFNWRADGSLKHAENPPKRYEDIVNPDFYSPLASSPRQAALWRALRDIVLFWVQQGVRIFRVDNPHTKPLPFWQWMLREVRDRHPDTIFLSEAFTRPAMMYRLAKVGFSQSYTYFTWRNTRHELTTYMTELNSAPVRDFFRPNFFVNTPDINPWFLQSSGRPGFLIRAVLATTLSGNWGMYNGFELCEAQAVPGKEEYLDSEKYQLRHWDMDRPGNIIDEITRLNRVRQSHPALQSHLGIRFHETGNEQVIFYSRHSQTGDSIVLVAVSLDPHAPQAATLELPRHEWGLPDGAPLPLHDLFEDRRFTLRGATHAIVLTPERPFVLWALAPSEGVVP